MEGREWYRIRELGPGLYAIVDVDGGWFRSNSLVACDPEEKGRAPLIVDAQYNEARGRELKRIAESLGCDEPGLLVITHHHGDHAWGAHAVGANTILMSGRAWEAASQLIGLVPDMYKPFFPWLDFTGSKYTRPSRTYSVQETVDWGGSRIVLVEKGPAHTISDTIVLFPDERVAVVGDLGFNRVVPFALDGTVEGWERLLRELIPELGDWRILPGHGEPGGAEILEATLGYLEWIVREGRRLYEEGVRDPIETLSQLHVPPEYRGWKHQERHAFNLERVYMDLEGLPPGSPSERLLDLAKLVKP